MATATILKAATWPAGSKILYSNFPIKRGRDQIVMKLIVEIPKASLVTGVDGWIGSAALRIPADGAKWSDAVTSDMDWTLYVEPTVEDTEILSRYHIGFALVTLTFIGSRVWAD